MSFQHSKDSDIDDDTPKNPTLETIFHIAFKGWQTGAIFGTLFAYPWVRLIRRQPFSLARCVQFAGNSSSTGLAVITAAGSMYVLPDRNTPKNLDRAYRLKYNKGQNRTDFYGTLGFCAFVLGGAALPPHVMAGLTLGSRVLGMGALGTSVGILAHVATNPMLQQDDEQDTIEDDAP